MFKTKIKLSLKLSNYDNLWGKLEERGNHVNIKKNDLKNLLMDHSNILSALRECGIDPIDLDERITIKIKRENSMTNKEEEEATISGCIQDLWEWWKNIESNKKKNKI